MAPPSSSLVVVSPHLDDAVLSCGALLGSHPGAAVVTVFAANAPERFHIELSEWDIRGGMAPGRDPVHTRRREDSDALSCVHARPVWLDFIDSQYAPTPHAEAVAAALAPHLHGRRRVLAPLGLCHSDHLLVSEAALLVFEDQSVTGGPAGEWWLYEDVPYRRYDDGTHLASRIAALEARGLALSDAVDLAGDHRASPASRGRKREAISRYTTQVRALTSPGMPGLGDTEAPERFWRIARHSAPTAEPR